MKQLSTNLLLLGIMLFASMLTHTAFAQSPTGIRLGNVAAMPGDNVNVPVRATNFQGIRAFQLAVSYDPAVVEFIAIANMHPNFTDILFNNQDGYVLISYFNLFEVSDLPDNEILLALQFVYCRDESSCLLDGGQTPLSFIEGDSYVIRGSEVISIAYENGSIFSGEQHFSLDIAVEGHGHVTLAGNPYSQPTSLPKGATVSLEAVPDAGWRFDGWSGSITSTSNPLIISMDGDKTLTARFTVIEHSLNVNIAGEGTVHVNGQVYTEQVVAAEGSILLLEAQPLDGWQFDGWDGDVLSENATVIATLERGMTVTATFSEIPPPQYTLTITIAGNGSVAIDGAIYVEPITMVEGTVLQLEALVPDGWIFERWSGSHFGTQPAFNLIMDSNKHVTAWFTEIPPPPVYMLTLEIHGNGSVSVNGTPYTQPLVVEENTVLSLSAAPSGGWQFEGWSMAISSTEPNATIVMDDNKLVVVTFSEIPPPPQYTLTLNITGNGTVTVNGILYTAPVTVVEGTALQLARTSAPGWFFVGWGGGLSGTQSPISLVMDADKNVTASFQEIPPEQFTLTINISGQGTVHIDSIEYLLPITRNAGTIVKLTATPAEGWQFAGWKGDLTGMDPQRNVLFDRNKVIEAVFTRIPLPKYTLTVSTTGNGQVRINNQLYTSPLSVEQGTVLALSAQPAAGWQFDGWTGSITDSASTTSVTMDTNKQLTATFSEIPPPPEYTLTLTKGGSGLVTVNGQPYTQPITVIEGTVLRLAATPASGWQFDGWTGDLAGVTTPLNVVMDGHKNIAVSFSEIPPPPMFTLRINISGNGTVLVGGQPYIGAITVEEGTVLQLERITPEGWLFFGWGGDLSGTQSTVTIAMTGDRLITATFTEIPPAQFTLTINITGQGSVLVDDVTYTNPLSRDEGITLNLKVVPDNRWQFDSWSGDLSGTEASQALVLDNHKEINVLFTEIPPEIYTLDIRVNGQGSITVNGANYTGVMEVEEGTTLDLAAHPAEGWQFDGWSGDLTASERSLSMEMTGNKHITALFSEISPPQEYTLQVLVFGNGMVSIDGEPYTEAVVHIEDTEILLQALPDEGWQFDGWSGDITGTATQTSIVIQQNMSIIASFSRIPPPTYAINFVIIDSQGITITDAVISFNGVAYAPGQLSFFNQETGTYDYTINRHGYFEVSGQVEITDSDVTVNITMIRDDTRLAESVTAKIVVYPNPATESLYIEATGGIRTLRMLNSGGQQVYDANLNGDQVHRMIIRELPAGVYFLQIFTNGGMRTERIVVVRNI